MVKLRGFSERVCADALGVERTTVRDHVRQGLRKLERVIG